MTHNTNYLTVEEMAAELTAKPYLYEFMQLVKAANLTSEQIATITTFLQEKKRQRTGGQGNNG